MKIKELLDIASDNNNRDNLYVFEITNQEIKDKILDNNILMTDNINSILICKIASFNSIKSKLSENVSYNVDFQIVNIITKVKDEFTNSYNYKLYKLNSLVKFCNIPANSQREYEYIESQDNLITLRTNIEDKLKIQYNTDIINLREAFNETFNTYCG